MTRWTFLLLSLALTLALLAPATAGPNFLPRLRLPRINGGKAIAALTYPVTKSLVNGGKTVLKVGRAADSVGLVPSIGPPVVSRVVKRTLWGVGRH